MRCSTTSGLASARILIADDHELMRRGIRALLSTDTKLEICGEAENGQDAVEKVRTLNPDLVILDLNMRVMNGIEATREIRQKALSTKILVYSMHESPQIREALREAGADAYVLKSGNSTDLRKAIQTLLQTARS